MNQPDIYSTEFVKSLFDEMSQTYDRVNYTTSFGFSQRWRRQFIRKVRIPRNAVVCDMMCGMGECWFAIHQYLKEDSELLAIDLSSGMLQHARTRSGRYPGVNITIEEQDALSTEIDSGSVDCVISGFGIKTFSDPQKRRLAAEMYRILKPNGTFSLVEISVPRFVPLKLPYLFYLERIIPILGKLLLGNPENYRMLGVYTRQFGDCQLMKQFLTEAGFEVNFDSYFFGCATGVSGRKPA